MSTDKDLHSPSKKRRVDMTATNGSSSCRTSAVANSVSATTTTAATITPPPPLSRMVMTTTKPVTPCFVAGGGAGGVGVREAAPCLVDSGQKDSIIAQILASTDPGDFGDTSSFCTSGVLFDDATSYTSSSASDTTPGSFTSSNETWTREPVPQYSMMAPGVNKVTRSLLVSVESRGCSLQQNIEQVVADHDLITCSAHNALALCNEQVFQLIWLQLPCPPSEDMLGVITGIRYNSKLNRKTIQLGVSRRQPEIDLNLHGIHEVLLEPVSKATIRRKYFDWTSVKLTPDYEISMRDPPPSPTTPESSVSTESTVELSLSSLASDTTNDSGIQGEVDSVDLKPPPSFMYSHQQCRPLTPTSKLPKLKPTNGRPSTPPSWCRMEHATKEKHRRERIKDSCDQLRVLLPYVRGRKTDMASILEMTVDYLKIVNSKLPHEFHAHVLDVMTKGGNSPPSRPARSHLSCGRGSRGGRGRGPRRGSLSPVSSLDSSENRMLTRALSRGTMSSPLCTVLPRGNGSSSDGTLPKRGSQSTMMLSPGNQGMSNLYLVDGKDRGSQREESGISNSLSLPSYLTPSHYSTPHLFDTSASSSSAASVSPHAFPPTPGHGTMPTSTSDCGLPVPRLYASAHLTVEPSFLSHGPLGNPAPLAPPIPTRYALGGDRDGSAGSGLAGSFGDSSTPAYYHYFSNVADINPAYTVASGGGSGEFMTSTPFHPLPSNSAFAPSRLQLAPSRGKVELPPQSTLENGDGNVYGMMDSSAKTTK